MLRPVALIAVFVSSHAFALETLRIAMGETRDFVTIEGEQLGFASDLEDARYVSLNRKTVTLRPVAGRLWLDGAPLTDDAVRFRAGHDALDGGVPGERPIHAGSHEVRGDVVVKLKGDRLLLINVIPLEEYLEAVLGGEMPVSFPLEALKAQAVAARTYAVRRKIETYGADFHLGSSVLAQVYGGVHREDPRTRTAVAATRGEVLTWELEPIEAYFHASCGGRTESGLEALGRDLPYLESVECPCGKTPASHWSLVLQSHELKDALKGADPRSVAVVSRSPTGRARRVRIGPDRTVDAVTFRERLGYTRLKSLEFEIDSENSSAVHISGRGYGHGAGMCQWGAKLYAEQGWSYPRILEHYYPGAELQRLY